MGVLGLALLYVGVGFLPPSTHREWHELGSLPVLHLGRVKPIDSVARSTLLGFKGNQSLKGSDTHTPTEWLFKVMSVGTDDMNLFMVRQSEVLNALNQNPESKPALSFKTLLPHLTMIDESAQHAQSKPAAMRSLADREWLRLRQNVVVYTQLKNTLKPEGVPSFSLYTQRYIRLLPPFRTLVASHMAGQSTLSPEMAELLLYFKQFQHISEASAFRVAPPDKPNGVWKTLGDAYLILLKEEQTHPLAPVVSTVMESIEADDQPTLTQSIASWNAIVTDLIPSGAWHAKLEYTINRADVMIKITVLYGVVVAMCLMGWLMNRPTWWQLAQRLGWLTWVIHSLAIGVRMWLVGRPPVTNLYTSAVFVGWVAIVLGLYIERRSRLGLGTMVSGIIGVITLIIAHHLSLQGDTMEMMQAVLDSNFWLSTHVITICMGYGAVFLAGALANIGVIRLVTGSFSGEQRASLSRMIYGVLAAGLVLSFIGTVLGGIWADQSWGRFWGWDPKENGAFIICVWVAAILHARWGGMIKDRGLWVMSIFGNIVTAFSWFGVNMLGVGLHSYGFMDQAFFWLMVFNASQLVMMWLAFWPKAFSK